jgi:hypothetical protein
MIPPPPTVAKRRLGREKMRRTCLIWSNVICNTVANCAIQKDVLRVIQLYHTHLTFANQFVIDCVYRASMSCGTINKNARKEHALSVHTRMVFSVTNVTINKLQSK